MMRHIISVVLFIGLMLTQHVAYSDAAAATGSDLQGAWKLDTTKNSLTDRRPAKREDSWEFKEGKLTITHIPRAGTYYDQLPEPYTIEGDKLTVTPMGSSKSEVYSIVEKTNDAMTLKGKYGTYYFFSKK